MNWVNNAETFERDIARTAETINAADAVFVGVGAGLSTAAGFTYSGERFERHFADFHARYGFTDMYSGGFYPYATSEELWAFWRAVLENSQATYVCANYGEAVAPREIEGRSVCINADLAKTIDALSVALGR